MRPRETESSPAPSTPPPSRLAGNLSSMVVRPSDASTGDGDLGYNCNDFERRASSPTPRRRGFERNSPAGFRRRSPTTSPVHRPYRSRSVSILHGLVARLEYGRKIFNTESGSVSPPTRRLRPNGSRSHYDREFSPPHFSRGYVGGRGRGRFRNMSPPRFTSGFGRANDGRFHGRGYEFDRHLRSPFEDDEFDDRNDPNVSPREGDWICVNPRCGNLNFSRRTHCNSCDQPRFTPNRFNALPPARSPPRRGRFYAPWRSPPSIAPRGPLSPPIRRNFNTTQDYNRREGKFNDPISRQRDYEDDNMEYRYHNNSRGRRGGRSGGGSHWPSDDEWRTADPTRRGGYDRRELSPLPRDRWARKRSRTPPYNSNGMPAYRGRGGRHYDRDGGRGFRPRDGGDDDSFSRGRGGPNRGMSHDTRNQSEY